MTAQPGHSVSFVHFIGCFLCDQIHEGRATVFTEIACHYRDVSEIVHSPKGEVGNKPDAESMACCGFLSHTQCGAGMTLFARCGKCGYSPKEGASRFARRIARTPPALPFKSAEKH